MYRALLFHDSCPHSNLKINKKQKIRYIPNNKQPQQFYKREQRRIKSLSRRATTVLQKSERELNHFQKQPSTQPILNPLKTISFSRTTTTHLQMRISVNKSFTKTATRNLQKIES